MTERKAFTLQVTERCNLACRYCYVPERPVREEGDCSPELCRAFVDFAVRESGPDLKLSFFGGEPLLQMDVIRYVVGYAKQAARQAEKNLSFQLNTNGMLLDDSTGDFLAQENVFLELSLDGPAEIHDRARTDADGNGSFQVTYGNLLRFRSRHPEHPISLFSVITSTTALPWLQSLAKEINASLAPNPMYLSPSQEQDWPADCRTLTANSQSDRLRIHREQFCQGNTGHDEVVNHHLRLLLSGRVRRHCEVGINTTVTTQSGQVYPCPFFVGHPDQVIGDVFHGFVPEKVQPFLDREVASLPACAKCVAKHTCAGGCSFAAYQRNGSIQQPWAKSCENVRLYTRRLQNSLIELTAKRPEVLLAKLSGLPEPGPRSRRASQGARIAPRNFVIRLTGKCNLSCRYCYDRDRTSRHDHLEIDTARAIADYILAAPCTEPLVCLFGGEPLMNWDAARYLIETISQEAPRRDKRPFFQITTNGTLIDWEIAKTLTRYNAVVQISIDAGREQHNQNRVYQDGSGSYDAAFSGARLLREVNPHARIDAQVVLTPGNVDVLQIARHLRSAGFRRLNFLKQSIQGSHCRPWSRQAVEELIRAREQFYPFFVESVLAGAAEVDMGFAGFIASQPVGPQGLCECGGAEVFIDTAGDIYPCPQVYAAGIHRLGNVATAHPADGYPDPRTGSIDESCSTCWAYDDCRGGCLVQCQKCPLLSSPSPVEDQRLWCDLMRAELARARITYLFLRRYHPEQLKMLRLIFSG